MININNQMYESKGLEIATMHLNTANINANDLMRTSIMTKKSFNDVTTLAA